MKFWCVGANKNGNWALKVGSNDDLTPSIEEAHFKVDRSKEKREKQANIPDKRLQK